MGDQNWLEILINWFPMLLLIGVWVYFLRTMRGGKYMSAFQRDCMAETKRQADAMERIAAALEKRAI